MKKFSVALSAIAEIFGKDVTPQLLAGYEFALDDYDEDQLIAACKILARGEYFPKPHDFLEALQGPYTSPEDLANQAWSEVLAFAWGQARAPVGDVTLAAMSGVCDTYMIKHADERDLRNYGFAFRASYRALLDREEYSGLIDGSVSKLIGDTGKMITE